MAIEMLTLAAALVASGCDVLVGADFEHLPAGPGSSGGPAGRTPGDGAFAEDANTFDPARCAAKSADPELGIFVETSGTDVPSCGTPTTPCKTVAQAIGRAAMLERPLVYIAAGRYEESIVLARGVTLSGGWTRTGAAWTPICNQVRSAAVTVQARQGEVTVLADELGGESAIETLTIRSKVQNAVRPGESLVGVLARGATTSLRLTDVFIVTASAGDGADGTAASDGKSIATCTDPGDGADGAAGASGSDASAGTFGPDGYVPAAAAAGLDGEHGSNGAGGENKECRGSCVVACTWFSGGGCVPSVGSACTPDAGSPGCGGPGGIGGVPGQSGGSAVALLAWGSSVTITRGNLTSGDGGAGGRGGPGGSGAAGTDGEESRTSCYGTCGSGCSFTNDSPIVASAGGTGGSGGSGGNGGAGAGGFSFAVYAHPSARVVVRDAVLVHGAAGTSRGGGAAGAAGAIGAIEAIGQ